MDEQFFFKKCERVAGYFRLIEQIVTYKLPGQYHFNAFEKEYADYMALSREFSASPDPDISLMGVQMAKIVREMAKMDEIGAKYPLFSRAVRKQREAIAKACGAVIPTIERIFGRQVS